MADMRRTLKFIYFASQLCGISPYGSFLTNGGYEKPVLCRKYLVYGFILLIANSVGLLHFGIGILRQTTEVSSEAHRVNLYILLIIIPSMFTLYLVTATTRLIGQRNFFKISRKLLSVGSFVNYREGTAFSNAVIALHVVSFITYLIRYSLEWISNGYYSGLLLSFVSSVICDTVTSFAAIQFLYFVFTLRRHFMLLNSSLNEVVMSAVTSESVRPLDVHTVPEFLSKRNSVNSGLRGILHRQIMMCDILELINSSYGLQILAFIGTKFVYSTILFYLLCFSLFAPLFPVASFVSLLPVLSHEVIQIVTVVYCCNSASFQVGVI
jgi:hypothetical protein